jgi:hypothetical protein
MNGWKPRRLETRHGHGVLKERRFVSILRRGAVRQEAAAFPDPGVTRKRKTGSSPAEISGQFLRRLGFRVSHQERWNAHAGKRQDLFGFIDILAIHPELQITLGVQSTTFTHITERMKKIEEACSKAALDWLSAGNQIQIYGWKTMKPRGKRPYRRVAVLHVRLCDGTICASDVDHYTYSKAGVPGFAPWNEQKEDFFRKAQA